MSCALEDYLPLNTWGVLRVKLLVRGMVTLSRVLFTTLQSYFHWESFLSRKILELFFHRWQSQIRFLERETGRFSTSNSGKLVDFQLQTGGNRSISTSGEASHRRSGRWRPPRPVRSSAWTTGFLEGSRQPGGAKTSQGHQWRPPGGMGSKPGFGPGLGSIDVRWFTHE